MSKAFSQVVLLWIIFVFVCVWCAGPPTQSHDLLQDARPVYNEQQKHTRRHMDECRGNPSDVSRCWLAD